jgi:hypothetical protein
MSAVRRPVMVGVLVAAVIALVTSAAVAFGASDETYAWGASARGQGTGMMGGQGRAAGRSAGSMMGSVGMVWLPGDGAAVSSIPAARARATTAGAQAGLHPGEVIWFDNGFYVELKDSTQKPATEVIVDPGTGSVSTEPGPAMMWNSRFGMMRLRAGGTGRVNSTKARSIATSWLATNRAGTTVRAIDAYPGYFTLDLQSNGAVSGMMSVSSVTGAVWYHTWHGTFIAMED